MLSRISRRRCLGSLEDTDLVSKGAGDDVEFKLIASRDVYSLRDQPLYLGHYCCVVEQVHASVRVKIDEQIDVAVRPRGAAGRRSEKRKMFDAELLEERCGRAQDLQNAPNLLRVEND
jgi:hypothetical protein